MALLVPCNKEGCAFSLRVGEMLLRNDGTAWRLGEHVGWQRGRLQREWANGNARQSARDASAVVVNPTHLCIAIHYDPDEAPVPL